MKIAKERLKTIIKEELEAASGHDEFAGGEHLVDQHGYEGRMVKQNLWKIAEYAEKMHNLIADNEDLEPWVEEKIAIAAYMMDSVGHYLQYEKHVGHEEGEGETDHVDFGGEDELELDIDDLGGEEPEYDEEDEYGDEEDEDEEERMTEKTGHNVKGEPDKYIRGDGKKVNRGLWSNVAQKKKREGHSEE
jgi:chromosomal replication initiation ATPase DnaA